MKIDLYILPGGLLILDSALTLLVTALAYKFDGFKKLSCYDYRNFAKVILLFSVFGLIAVFVRYWDFRRRAHIIPPEDVHENLDQELDGREAEKIGTFHTHKARQLLFLASVTFINLITVAIGSIQVIVTQTVLINDPSPRVETWRLIQ
ncbi:hypothetical protein WICPIJ_005759 [Wickerhamomyces pijperi]|uniref:Uncharacterized protein n=1 Tax=Wickerhamomyces pijperi TaxID=599730 RepID=A0A9P8Q5K7_WICPI|nr:hypothetical protein WICPIJ_005759 [Wickerhamomyces pijperi]